MRTGDCFEDMKNSFLNLPAINKGLLICCLVLYLLDFIFNGIIFYSLCDVAYLVFFKGHVWRILTAFLIHNSIINLIFSIWLIL